MAVGAEALGAFRPDERSDGFAGRARSGASRDSTVFFEQIGQSAVKRLWRQKSEDTRPSEGTRLPTCLRC